MNVLMFVYVFILFFVLTPRVLVSLPPKGSKMVVAATHALVFSLLFCTTYKMVLKFTNGTVEGMNNKITCEPGQHYSLEVKDCIPDCEKGKEHYDVDKKSCVQNECGSGQYIPTGQMKCVDVPNCGNGKYFSQRFKECRDNLTTP